MAASTFPSSACRYGWKTYANQVISEIHTMKPEERTQSINQLRDKCVLLNPGLPKREEESLLQYSGGMTEKELELRATLQSYFDPLSVEVLQSHFTFFCREKRVITNLLKVVTDDTKKEQLGLNREANGVIVDELGKSLLRKDTQPQLPPAEAQQKVFR